MRRRNSRSERAMPILLRLAVFYLLLLPAAAVAETVTVKGIGFPDQVGDFTRGNGRDYEKTHPGLGYSFAYRREPWTATVYVYDQRRAIPDDLGSEIVKREFAAAARDVLEGPKLGISRKAELVGNFTLPERDAPRFTCANFTVVTRESVDVTSLLCITSSKGKFVKFRVTGAGADPGDALRFIEAWTPMLAPGT
jgi:hypothetical protein